MLVYGKSVSRDFHPPLFAPGGSAKVSHWIFLYSKYHLFSKKINKPIVIQIIRRLSISVGLSRKLDFIVRSIFTPPPCQMRFLENFGGTNYRKFHLCFQSFFPIISPCYQSKNISTSSVSVGSECPHLRGTISISDIPSQGQTEQVRHFSTYFDERGSRSLSDTRVKISEMILTSSSTPRRSSRSRISPQRSRYMGILSWQKPEI